MEIELLELPEEILTCTSGELWRFCPPLSLFRIPGQSKSPVVISILLHGDEDAGLLTLQGLLSRYGAHFPRECILLVGNTKAAQKNLRHLEGQPDYNRIWRSTGEYEEQNRAQKILSFFKQRSPFAYVDLHNNSGTNPHYICINKKEHRFFQMADLFEGPTVFFDDPIDVLTLATSILAPSAVLECGKPGDREGAQKAIEFLDKLLTLDDWPINSNKSHVLFEVVAKINIPTSVSFSIGQGDEEVILNRGLESLNFKDIVSSEVLAHLKNGPLSQMLQVTDNQGKVVTDIYLELKGKKVFIKPGVTPSMLTLSRKATKQDVLGYLMKKVLY